MATMHNLPPSIATVRSQIFCIDSTVVLSKTDWDLYWPYCDNIWSLARQNTNKEKTKVTSYYDCRLHPTNDHVPEGSGKSLRKRQKPSRTAIGCPIKMKVIRHEDFVEMIRVGSATVHNHDLDTSDREKRPSIFRKTAADEVSKGYKVSEVTRNTRAVDRSLDRAALQEAGGHWLSLKDVHKASASWKLNNPINVRMGGEKHG